MDNNGVMLEFDGPDVAPGTVDAVPALELAGAYLRLLERISQEHGNAIHFTGIEIIDKCAALKMQINVSPTALRRAVMDANDYIRGRDQPSQTVEPFARRVRGTIHKLPENYDAKVIVGKWSRRLCTEEAEVAHLAEEVTTLRARVLRVGGLRPSVRLRCESESSDFSLSLASEEIACLLARYLYTEIEITARIHRDEEGEIEGGWLEEFEAVSAMDPTEAWRDWFKKNASAWNDVDDLEGEIRRGRE